MSQIKFDATKFRELMLYVAQRSATDPQFGKTKLNKILYFSDFLAYGLTGHAIAGATYQKLDKGPAPRQFLPVSRELELAGAAVFVEEPVFNHKRVRMIAKR